MALVAYSKYRIYVTRTASTAAGAPRYCTINEFRGFPNGDGSGSNLFTGGTASASDVYLDQTANLAFDGNAATYWESNNATSGFRWLRYDLESAVVIRNFYLSSTQYPDEVPRDFLIQGSNDGTTWTTLFQGTDWVTTAVAKTGSIRVDLMVGGASLLDTGAGATKVFILRYADGGFIGTAVPNAVTGEWQYHLHTTDDLLVTHIGPSGFRPISDGPITPYAE